MQLSTWAWSKQAKLMQILQIKNELKYSTKSGPFSGMINVKNMEKEGNSLWTEDIRKTLLQLQAKYLHTLQWPLDCED